MLSPDPSSITPSPPSPPSALSAATLLLTTDLAVPDLAAKLQIPLPDLLALLDSDEGASHLGTLVRLTNLRAAHKQAQSRLTGLTILEDIAKTTEDPQERRRAATALVRGHWTYRPTPASVNPDRQGGARNPLNRSPQPRGAAIPNLSFADLSCELSPPSPSHRIPVSPSQAPPAASPPSPSITPSPSHTPDTLARAIAADLAAGDIVQTAATLAAISTASLRHDPENLLDRLEPHLGLPTSAHISPPTYHKPTPPHRHACRIRLSHSSHTLTLGFARLHNQPWLLNHLDTT